MQVLLDREAVARGLRRVAGEIVERHRGTGNLLLVGIRRGGVHVADQIKRWLTELEGDVPMGTVDISLYRDDAATALPNPRIGPSEIPNSLDGVNVVVVDDVLYTGRTVRAALDALMDYGRPARVELAVLIDRGGRELPIRADYVVKTLEVDGEHRVDVISTRGGLEVVVQPTNAPSVPPERP